MSEGDGTSKRTMTTNQKTVVKAESSEEYFARNVEQAVMERLSSKPPFHHAGGFSHPWEPQR